MGHGAQDVRLRELTVALQCGERTHRRSFRLRACKAERVAERRPKPRRQLKPQVHDVSVEEHGTERDPGRGPDRGRTTIQDEKESGPDNARYYAAQERKCPCFL